MKPADRAPFDEMRWRDALHRLSLLGMKPEPVFDAVTAAAAELCDTPVALVSFFDGDREWFKSNRGLPGQDDVPRTAAFADDGFSGEGLIEIGDTRADPRFCTHPLVAGETALRFYAGAAIVLPGGQRVGVVSVLDRVPRTLGRAERAALTNLARVAGAAVLERGREPAPAPFGDEHSYRSIVDGQTELISIADRDGNLSFVNPAYAAFFGQTPTQIIGRNLFDFIEESDRAAVCLHWDAVCRHGVAASDVNRMGRRDGSPCWVAWTNRPLLDSAGQTIGMQSVGRDVTLQKLAEQALADSELRYRSLYEATPANLHSINVDRRIVAVSDRWLQLLGYERLEVIGRLVTDFMTPETAARAVHDVLPAFWRTGRCERTEYRFIHRDGTPIEVLLSSTLERHADGSPFRALTVLEDVTESRRLAAELSRTHARLDAIVDNVPAQLGYWDANGITRFVNREFQAAVGLPMEHIVDRPLKELYESVDPTAYAALAPRLVSVLQGKRQEFELPMLTVAGLRQMRLTLVPDQPHHGEVAGFFGMVHDITGRKALELRLSDSELRYRSLFDHLNSGFVLHEIVVDGEGKPIDYKFIAMNATYTAMTGIEPAYAVGKRVTEILPGVVTDPANWIGVFGRVALTGEPAHFEQYSQSLGRWFEIVAYRPAPGQFAVIAQDITRRKGDELRLSDALLEKETLLKEVYHRVKNNLQVVQSLLNLQRHTIADGAARTALAESVQRIRAMALVHEKLYQSGNLAAVSLRDYTVDLLKQVAEATATAQRRIELKPDIGDLQTGLDNAIPFGLLLAELVSNALKHAFVDGRGGSVRIEVTAAEGGTLLTVADDGVGLKASFDVGTSMSMGLQLANNLTRQLGGELRAFNGERGAVFQALLTRL